MTATTQNKVYRVSIQIVTIAIFATLIAQVVSIIAIPFLK